MLLGWRDAVEGVFAVERRDGEALVVQNLGDELTYRVRSNAGPDVLDRMPVGSFLVARLVPVEDEWLLSGYSWTLPASNSADAYRLAADLAQQRPALLFRNPAKLEQAWELQRQQRAGFIAFFGSDLVVVPGRELAERTRAYVHFCLYERRDDQGKSAADRAGELYGVVPPPADFGLPADLLEAETVGIMHDEVDGLNFFRNLGTVEEAFANPALAARGLQRQAVLDYLEDPSIPPSLLRRLAERDPDRASQVFRRLLKQPDFSWERDGEALLRRYKASYFERPVLPGVIPVTEAMARARLAAPAAPQRVFRRPPRRRR